MFQLSPTSNLLSRWNAIRIGLFCLTTLISGGPVQAAPDDVRAEFALDEDTSAGSVVGLLSTQFPGCYDFQLPENSRARSFDVRASDGQIRVRDGAKLSYKRQPLLTFMVTARKPNDPDPYREQFARLLEIEGVNENVLRDLSERKIRIRVHVRLNEVLETPQIAAPSQTTTPAAESSIGPSDQISEPRQSTPGPLKSSQHPASVPDGAAVPSRPAVPSLGHPGSDIASSALSDAPGNNSREPSAMGERASNGILAPAVVTTEAPLGTGSNPPPETTSASPSETEADDTAIRPTDGGQNEQTTVTADTADTNVLNTTVTDARSPDTQTPAGHSPEMFVLCLIGLSAIVIVVYRRAVRMRQAQMLQLQEEEEEVSSSLNSETEPESDENEAEEEIDVAPPVALEHREDVNTEDMDQDDSAVSEVATAAVPSESVAGVSGADSEATDEEPFDPESLFDDRYYLNGDTGEGSDADELSEYHSQRLLTPDSEDEFPINRFREARRSCESLRESRSPELDHPDCPVEIDEFEGRAGLMAAKLAAENTLPVLETRASSVDEDPDTPEQWLSEPAPAPAAGEDPVRLSGIDDSASVAELSNEVAIDQRQDGLRAELADLFAIHDRTSGKATPTHCVSDQGSNTPLPTRPHVAELDIRAAGESPTAESVADCEASHVDSVAQYLNSLLERSRKGSSSHPQSPAPRKPAGTTAHAPAGKPKAAESSGSKPPVKSYIEEYLSRHGGTLSEDVTTEPEVSETQPMESEPARTPVARAPVDVNAIRQHMNSFRQVATASVEHALVSHRKRQARGKLAWRSVTLIVMVLIAVAIGATQFGRGTNNRTINWILGLIVVLILAETSAQVHSYIRNRREMRSKADENSVANGNRKPSDAAQPAE